MDNVMAVPFVQSRASPVTSQAAVDALLEWVRQPIPDASADIVWGERGARLEAHSLRFVEWCLRNDGPATLALLRANEATFTEVHASVEIRSRYALI